MNRREVLALLLSAPLAAVSCLPQRKTFGDWLNAPRYRVALRRSLRVNMAEVERWAASPEGKRFMQACSGYEWYHVPHPDGGYEVRAMPRGEGGKNLSHLEA